MDVHRFDTLAKALGRGRLSRRGAIGRLGGAGVAALAGTAAGASAAVAQSDAAGDCGGQCDNRVPGDAGEAPAAPEELVVPAATLETLPALDVSPAGALRRLTDYDRALWLNTGAGWSSLDGHVFDVRGFGAVGDGTTDDWTAFKTAIEAMTSPQEADSTSPYGRTLLVPPGRYRLGQSLVLTRAVRIVGAVGSGQVGDAVLVPDPGIIGIVVEASDAPVRGRPGRRGEGARIERLRIEAGDGGEGTGDAAEATGDQVTQGDVVVATEAGAAAVHGVLLRARATLKDCVVVGFGGDGIHIDAEAAGDGGDGAAQDALEADGWEVHGCRVERCGEHGLYARGGSAGVAKLVLALSNRKFGIFDDSERGNTYLQCHAVDNGQGPFTTSGDNRSLFAGCTSALGQPRSVFSDETIVVGGNHAAGYQGGNAWVAAESRMLLRAQEPGSADDRIPTVPTLHIQQATGQTQPHLRISERGGERLAEFTVDGRLLVGPADLTPPPGGGGPDAPNAVGLQPVQIQVSSEESGEAAVRWVLAGDVAGWVAHARAYADRVGEGARDASVATRLTFQTPSTAGDELDTLTLRQGRVGIGTTGPAPAAILELASTTQGFLPSRMTTQQRDAIPSPPEGCTIYNLTTHRLNVHDGTSWQEVAFAAAGG